jgi:hypothetical protein
MKLDSAGTGFDSDPQESSAAARTPAGSAQTHHQASEVANYMKICGPLLQRILEAAADRCMTVPSQAASAPVRTTTMTAAPRVLVYRAAALQFICTFYSTLFDALGLQTKSVIAVNTKPCPQQIDRVCSEARRGVEISIGCAQVGWDRV